MKMIFYFILITISKIAFGGEYNCQYGNENYDLAPSSAIIKFVNNNAPVLITCGEFKTTIDLSKIKSSIEIDGEIIDLPIDIENSKTINLKLGESVEVSNESCFTQEIFKIHFSCLKK